MNRVDNPKSKIAQRFCKHKHTGWYTKKSSYPFSVISGERRCLLCEDCGKEIRSFFAEYEGMGFK